MKTVAIGDIHGHYSQLLMILTKLQDEIDFKKDTVVFLGDYVDGGPDTKGVLDELILLKETFPHWKFLYGNHEDLLLDAFDIAHPIYGDYYLWYNQGGKATLDSFKPARSLGFTELQRATMQPKDLITKEYLNFMQNLDRYYENDDYFFIHGGVYPSMKLDDLKEKIDTELRTGMVGERTVNYDVIWMRDPFIGSEYDWGKKIIFGHTVQIDKDPKKNLQPWIFPNKIGIDTMLHEKGHLTAVILPEEKFITSE